MPKLTSVIIIFIVLFTVFFGSGMYANEYQGETVPSFEQNTIEDYKQDSDFDYTETTNEGSNFIEIIKAWIISFLSWIAENIFSTKFNITWLSIFFEIMIYASIALLIFLIIKLFLNINLKSFSSKKAHKKADIQFTEDEHIIKNEDINKLIKEAVAKENYRLAVRYYYLLTLQDLSERELIHWEQQKTNKDYIVEISKEVLKVPFDYITNLYDYIWFGNFEIDQFKFLQIEQEFKKFNSKIATV
ncbi:DUF4129 domain-containing protein [Neptunitalea lumnitzerae]|uniref:DUF4129 domain-containing protein n=1 Tax=Neptunitalea lumnitzerae TaxID=2965509 RepID=A0ABQ5MLJ5_9FLAO|nr:DUF4129 domain-containing protein [Neptunitalea sp. Y10]GLB50264.1 hypothetical protein Y10_26320 [Neptunitalea sp. Y10]